jgi:hypothetical protein
MAQIIPSGWRELSASGSAQRELETLTTLAERLPDAYTVYHGVHWTRIEKAVSTYGEVDFVVLAPDGRVLLIEQKSGFLDETDDGLVKPYPGKNKQVASQIARNVNALSSRFGRHGERLSIDYLLYCPDYHVKRPQLAGVEPARIVDAARRTQLVAIIEEILPITEESPQRAKVAQFLGDVLELVPDPSTAIGQAKQLVSRLAGGLATWARQLEFSPYRLRVMGTAGSGKTQLALAECQAAARAGLRALYVCFNRPLADHIARLVPEGVEVATFHLLADRFVREQGIVPNYADAGVWRHLEEHLLHAPLPEHWRYDVIVIDEGQDFTENWRDAVLRLLRPDGRAIWLEDPMQNLYGRPSVPLDGWVTLHANTNYRSPRDVIDLLRRLGVAQDDRTMPVAASPIDTAQVDFLSYRDGDTTDMYAKTKEAIDTCLGHSFRMHDVALVSFHGRQRSALLDLDVLGGFTLRSFTGEYDAAGAPILREGALQVDSVYRFKGQTAPAVVLTEIDFEALDEACWRKLFVGMTRARLKLVLVLSERAAAALLDRMA